MRPQLRMTGVGPMLAQRPGRWLSATHLRRAQALGAVDRGVRIYMKSLRYAAAGALLMIAGLQPWAAQPSAQVSSWFRANFNNLNEAGANMYNFANRYAQSSSTWMTDHQSTGGW